MLRSTTLPPVRRLLSCKTPGRHAVLPWCTPVPRHCRWRRAAVVTLLGMLLLLVHVFMPVARAQAAAEATVYRSLIWIDLLPDEDLRALLNPPAILHVSSEEDTTEQLSLRRDDDGNFLAAEDDPFQLALTSTKVRPELDGQQVRLPGFIVPVVYNEEEEVTEFFLVPYFGACIHVPPPAPNQLLYATFPPGLHLPSIYEAYTVSGLLRTEITDNSIALSAYRLDAAVIEHYVDTADTADAPPAGAE